MTKLKIKCGTNTSKVQKYKKNNARYNNGEPVLLGARIGKMEARMDANRKQKMCHT